MLFFLNIYPVFISSVDYNLNSKFKKFTGELGVDDKTKNNPRSCYATCFWVAFLFDVFLFQ